MTGYRTYLLAAAVVLLGALQQLDVVKLVPVGYEGIALAVVGLAVAILRKVTNTPAGSVSALIKGPTLGLFLAFAVLGAATTGLTACASFEQLKPQSARELQAEAEIAFVGVLTVTEAAANHGYISNEQLQSDYIPKFRRIADGLDSARELIRAGDTDEAVRTLNIARAAISALSLQLHTLSEAAASAPATPAPAPSI